MVEQDQGASVLLALAERVAAYDPRMSLDNLADEMPLDLAIAKAFGVAAPDWRVGRGSVTGYFSGDGVGGFGNPTVPRYTRSLDAAMTLVPEGWRFEVTTTGFKPGASIITDRGTFINGGGAYAATPALALCAAALRARATPSPSPSKE